MSDRPPSPSQLQQSLQAGDLFDPGVYLHWEQCENCPMRINSHANSVFINGKLYIGGGGVERPFFYVSRPHLFVYTPSEDSWEIIDKPAGRYTLATYRSQLVLVGSDSQAGKVWLLEDGRRWVPHPTIPALPHSSSVLTAVGFDDCLLALVDEGIPGPASSRTVVKLFKGQTWFTGEVPERPFSLVPQFVVNGDDDLYLYQWNAVHRTSLQSLVASVVTPGAPPAQWEELPDPPLSGSSITWFGGHLLAVGGLPGGSAVHAYNHAARKWEHVSDVPSEDRYGSCCAVLSTGELLVVEGRRTSTRVLKATIRVSHTAESLSLTTSSDLLHTLEQAVAGLSHKRNKEQVQVAMETLAALKERLAAKEGEHFHQQPAPGIPTDPPLKAGELEAGMKTLTLSKHDTSSDHIFKMTLLQPQAATGSKASLMLDTLSAARKEYWTTLEHTEELDIESLLKPEIPVEQETKREEMMLVAELTSATPTVAELRGVEAIAGTFVRVTRAGCSFHWAGYGLKLTFPPNCLPPGVEECIIKIQASISGQYQLPEGTALVSAVYWFKCKPQIIFEQPFTLEIQNCAKPENVPKLKFYRASSSQQELPYSFQPLENGVFTKHSSYGSVELDQFCGVTVGQEEMEERNCCASLFYFGDNEQKKNVDLVISLDLDTHITEVLKAYESIKNAFIALRKIVEFEREKIYLEMKTHITKNGWTLTALALPMVKKSQVDNFNQTPPCCSLELKYTGSENPPVFEVQIPLKGTTVPEDFITIQSEPTCRATVCEMLRKRTEQPQSTSLLRSKRKLSGESHSPAAVSSEPVKRTKSTTADTAGISAVPPASQAAPTPILPELSTTPPPGPSELLPQPFTVPYPSSPFSSHLSVQHVYHQAYDSSYPPHYLAVPEATPQEMTVPTLIDYQNRLPAEAATTTPSPNGVAHIATAMNDWKGLCYIMGFTDADKNAIDRNNSTEEHKRTAVLDMWKRRRGSAAATFAELVSMAYQANDLILVEKIIEVASFPHSH